MTARRRRGATLAERLGHRPDARLLIINADDLGCTHGANVAAFQALREGAVTSTTLMVPCPWAAAAARMARTTDDIGVHLTLTSEWAGYRWGPLTDAPTLRAADGRMHRTAKGCQRTVVRAGRRGLEQLRDECAAQVDRALAWKVDVTHLDAHMGTMQTHPAFAEVYLELAASYRLPLRMVSPSHERALGFETRAPAAQLGIVHPDHYVNTYLDARPQLERIVASLRPGVTEILLHPSVDSADLRAGFPDAAERVANYEFACVDKGLPRLVEAHGVTLMGYRELRDLQRREGTA